MECLSPTLIKHLYCVLYHRSSVHQNALQNIGIISWQVVIQQLLITAAAYFS